jgi:exonuclease SbcC
MRPLELTLEGFRSYRDRTVLDFRGRRLIGVVGPIGAGKSSILDAIAFALYGRTPGVASNTKSLIHQLSDVAHVELVFEVDGRCWRVQRALRRKGASGHKIERLAADDRDSEALETIAQEKATKERVEQLLGMSFDAFCRSVLLAQNRFAEFLKAAPVERNEVLKGVFGFERFDAALAAAKERVARAEGELSGLEVERRRLDEARSALSDAREAAQEAASRAKVLLDAKPRAEELDQERVRARRAESEASTRLQRVREIAEGLPNAPDLESTLATAEGSLERVTEATQILLEAEASSKATVAHRDELAASMGDLREFGELVTRLEQQAAAYTAAMEAKEAASQRATTGEREAAKAETSAASAASAVEKADRALEAAIRAREKADEALHEARHRSMADELRRHLEVGAPCPVCKQNVGAAVAPGRGAAAVTGAEKASAKTAAAEKKARSLADAARATSAKADAEASAAARRASETAAELDAAVGAEREAGAVLAKTKSELVDSLGEGDPRALLEEREHALEGAEALVAQASELVGSARAQLDAARSEQEQASSAVGSLATRLAGSWGLLGESREVKAEAGQVRRSFVEIGERVLKEMSSSDAEVEAARRSAEEAETSLAALLEDLGFEDAPALVSASLEADARARTAAERVSSHEDAIAMGSDIDERVESSIARRDLASRLRDLLQPSQLLAFALEEERASLAELGSVHLEELTAGAFRFADDGTFKIVDVNAGGTVRSAESLSGGETFLASLSLALALAEMVTRGGGRMDAFLLDEGFGALDPEHLDRAMDGIGRLVAGGDDRLVVLVSHVEQMRQVMEDLIVLDKDDRTGNTVVVSGATLG